MPRSGVFTTMTAYVLTTDNLCLHTVVFNVCTPWISVLQITNTACTGAKKSKNT